MSSNIEHLIKLAQKTGDTLIIQDPRGSDMVVMDVNRYEMLHDMSEIGFGNDYGGLYDLDEREFIDKINRDIAIWRSHQETEEQAERADELEDEAIGELIPDFYEEDEDDYYSEDSNSFFEDEYLSRRRNDPFAGYDEPWHRAGDVLNERHNDFDLGEDEWDDSEDEEDDKFLFDDKLEGEDDGEMFGFDNDNFVVEDMVEEHDNHEEFSFDSSFNNTEAPQQRNNETKNESLNAVPVYHDLGEEAIMPKEKQPIPFVDHEQETKGSKEEPIDENEPVFFEEPV